MNKKCKKWKGKINSHELKENKKIVQHPCRIYDFGAGSLTDDEGIDYSIDDAILEKTRFHPFVGEANERSVFSVIKVG